MGAPDIIVVGAGHAGIEAAVAAARMGAPTTLITPRLKMAGRMPCNPAVGGMAKGHLVREIDALGGVMGELTDRSAIQFKRLGTSRGLAVQSSRAQCDKIRYRAHALRLLRSVPGLRLVEGAVVKLRLERDPKGGSRIAGVELADGSVVSGRFVILCAGTFLGGRLHTGFRHRAGGRGGERPSLPLARQLRELELPVGRLKTGTVPRLDLRSIDWEGLPRQEGDDPSGRFSPYRATPRLPQLRCRVTHTTERTRDLVRKALDRSPVHVGIIEGAGPRYCPSFEDKVSRFPERSEHRIFLEPEGLDTPELYPNGISTALPVDVQRALVQSIPGLETARILRPGYAVSYDFVDPHALNHQLSLDKLPGLYLAGQINGTTGYEEAAAQGLWAGINAVLASRDREPFVLRRDQAYLGVLVDDLVTRGVSEPYRMFSSRAEHRLLLREDNADLRLMSVGRELGLVDDALWGAFQREMDRRASLRGVLEERQTPSQQVRSELDALDIETPRGAFRVGELLARRDVDWTKLSVWRPQLAGIPTDTRRALEAEYRYAPYLDESRRRIAADLKWLERPIPGDLDFAQVGGLRSELVERWSHHRPQTVGQASRMRGSTPAAITALIVHLAGRERSGP
jgi:tRNA uridine 5-carboxymethylaminomethyl modification enzyme